MSNKRWSFLFFAWLTALLSSAGSLFFSEVMKYPPCPLCWYQRMCMFPLVLVILSGLFPYQPNTARFSFPLAFMGLLISFYHNLLYYKVIPESLSPCQSGVSCLTRFFEWGMLSIPLLSFFSFLLISVLLFFSVKGSSYEK